MSDTDNVSSVDGTSFTMTGQGEVSIYTNNTLSHLTLAQSIQPVNTIEKNISVDENEISGTDAPARCINTPTNDQDKDEFGGGGFNVAAHRVKLGSSDVSSTDATTGCIKAAIKAASDDDEDEGEGEDKGESEDEDLELGIDEGEDEDEDKGNGEGEDEYGYEGENIIPPHITCLPNLNENIPIYSNQTLNVSIDAEWFYRLFYYCQLPPNHPRKNQHKPNVIHSKITQFLTIQIASHLKGAKMYTHPECPTKCSTILAKHGVTAFKNPCALFDYYNLEWRDTPKDSSGKPKHSHRPTIKFRIFIFYAVKDLQSTFKDKEVYADTFDLFEEDIENVKLAKTRRTRINNGRKNSILLPYQVRVENSDTGRMEWNNASLELIDISAMQGPGTLFTYAGNVGIKMTEKEVYTKEQKGRMNEMITEGPKVYIWYGISDVLTPDGKPLIEEIYYRTNDFYNQIAMSRELQPRECWGLSVGKVTASMMTEFFANNPKLNKALTIVQNKLEIVDNAKLKNGKEAEKRPFNSLFYLANKRAGIQGFANAGRADFNKMLSTYGSMVDGGRATANRLSIRTYHEGTLVDIDISGCYANGLIAQDFAVGNPTIVAETMKFGQFLKDYQDRLVAGLWCARISWNDAPFGCDLLISKTTKEWKNWENGQYVEDEDDLIIYTEEDSKIYDANMVMQTHSIHQAILQHDLLQLIKKVPEGRAKEGGFSSRNEWKWLLENAVITSFAGYLKEDEIQEATEEMFQTTLYSNGKNNDVICKSWVRIPMADWIKPLIDMRKQHKKGTPMNTFLKLICNATYGVIASSFFSGEGYGISDMVVGNNITARARCLAWMMEKSLGCLNIATDGGVYDINKVIVWLMRSLDAANNLSYEKVWDSAKNQRYQTIPMLGEYIGNIENIHDIDIKAWEWVKKTFPHSDICKFDQFKFESKMVFKNITFHSKSDYLLREVTKYDETTGLVKGAGDDVMKMRGLRSDKRNEQNKIMDAARELKGAVVPVESEQILSLKNHHKGLNTNDTSHLLPGDVLIKNQKWYSVTPLANKWYNSEHYEIVMKMYDKLREKNDAKGIAELIECDVDWYIKNYVNK